jgi:low temperature requirement protein LtrA
MIEIGGAALVLVFALWWLYFLQPAGDGLVVHRERSYLWGYGHYGLLAALTAVGAGLELAVEQTGHAVAASGVVVGYAIAIPVTCFLLLTWALHAPIAPRPTLRPGVILTGGAAILAVPATGAPVTLVLATIGGICASLVALTLALTDGR